jgi:hypothetical protein
LPQSVLNWSNPERKTFVGGLFLWVKQSRPMIALCVYPNAEMYDFEFQSLADRPLTVYERGSPVWQPSEAGIVWHTLTAKELTPSRSPLVRRRQMRQIASQFTAKLVPPNRPEKPLRLQDAPVYRYPPKKLPDGCLDGGVFCFVLGTDPELLLIIEAVKEDDDVSVYRYAVARTTFVPMQVYHSTDLIFEVGWASRRFSGTYNVIQHAK